MADEWEVLEERDLGNGGVADTYSFLWFCMAKYPEITRAPVLQLVCAGGGTNTVQRARLRTRGQGRLKEYELQLTDNLPDDGWLGATDD